jgi:hypothetical protein
MKTKHPAFWPIWVKNFKGAFHYGYQFSEKGGFKGNVLPFLHTLCLPFTLTIGVTVKSIIDTRSRKLLDDKHLSKLKDAINNMEDERFNKIVSGLYNNKAKSNSSQFLFYKLADEEMLAKDNFAQHIKNKMGAAERELEIAEYRRLNKLGKNLDRYPRVALSEEQETAIVQKHQGEFAQFKQQRIQAQRTLLLGFLNQPHNAGKKTGHVLYQVFCNYPHPTLSRTH